MGSKTKIVILQTKELIYTGILVVLGILFILLLIFMFFPSDKNQKKLLPIKQVFIAPVSP